MPPPESRSVEAPRLDHTSGRDGPARQASLREHNLALVMATIVRADVRGRPIPRSRIAAETGLTKATVSELADLLISAHLVQELDPDAPARAGRPATPLAPAARTVVGLGLSVAVGHLCATVVDLTGMTLTQRIVEADLRRCDPTRTLQRLARLGGETIHDVAGQGASVAGACVSVPGLVNRLTGAVRYAPNLDWTDVDVPTMMRTHAAIADLPVFVANDADLSARNEIRERVIQRAADSAEDQSFLYVYGAIGIGSALVVDGRVFRGLHGFAGEIGHSVVEPAGPVCSCGATGCLELYAGRQALLATAGLEPTTALESLVEHLDVQSVRTAPALSAAARALGQIASTVLNVVDIDDVVLGGDYRQLYDHLASGVGAELQARVLGSRLHPPTVRRALGGPYSDTRGGALTILDAVIRDPTAWVDRVLAPA